MRGPGSPKRKKVTPEVPQQQQSDYSAVSVSPQKMAHGGGAANAARGRGRGLHGLG